MSIRRNSRSLLLVLAVAAVLAAAAHAAPASHVIVTGQSAGWPEVRTWTAQGARGRMWSGSHSWPLQFAAYPTYEKGVRVAVADVTGDGRNEIVTTPGSDAWTTIEIFDGRSYERLHSLPPWPRGSWWGGAYVAAADATGDRAAEVVVGLGPGCCTTLRVLDVRGGTELAALRPWGETSDGARVAAGDLSGDGRAEVVAVPIGGNRISVLAAAGGAPFRSFAPFGETPIAAVAAGNLAGDARAEVVAAASTPAGAQVKVVDAATGAVVSSWFPFGSAFAHSLAVATGDLDGDGDGDLVVSAATPEGTRVRGMSADGTTLASFFVLEPAVAPGASLAAGDLDGDGRAEIVLGSGPTTSPAAPAVGPAQQVAVLDRSGRTVRVLAAYPGRFQGAVRVATGDLSGSERPEVVTAPGAGVSAEIGVYSDEWRPDRDRGSRLGAFLAFEPSFLGGATVAVGDVAREPGLEIVVGAGPGRAPEVRVFDPAGRRLSSFVAFGNGYRDGIDVAAGDVDGDGRAEIVASTLAPPARVRVFDADGTARSLLVPTREDVPVAVAVADLDGDGSGEIVMGRGAGDEPWVEEFDARTGVLRGRFLAFRRSFDGGVHVAGGDVDGDGRAEIVVAAASHGDAVVRVFDRRYRLVRAFHAYEWPSSVDVAVRIRGGLPLVAFPRRLTVAKTARRALVIATFRDLARSAGPFRARISWPGLRAAAAPVYRRGGGVYDVVVRRRFARAGSYPVTVTLVAPDGRTSTARSAVVVRSR